MDWWGTYLECGRCFLVNSAACDRPRPLEVIVHEESPMLSKSQAEVCHISHYHTIVNTYI